MRNRKRQGVISSLPFIYCCFVRKNYQFIISFDNYRLYFLKMTSIIYVKKDMLCTHYYHY